MVMLSSTLRGRVLRFHSSAVPPNTLLIAELEGEEEISRPYAFHLDLVSAKADLDYEALLSHPASIGIKQGITIRGSASRGVQTLRIHGVLSAIEQGEKGDDWVVYRATLVPRLWRLSLNTRSRIFMDKTVPEIVAEVLQGNGFEPDDFEFRTAARPYPRREFVVQYQESDLQFVSRWLEHEGIFYFFKQEDEREKVVFADAPAYEPILGDGSLRYHPEGQLGEGATKTQVDWFAPERVARFQCRFQLTPKEVVLRDYNWRTPGVDLKASSEVAETAFGTAYHYGEHYKDQGEGKALAQIRAEELKCRRKVFQGTGDGRSFQAGSTFQLEGHYRPEFNTRHLIVSVKHRATQAMVLGAPVAPTATYENEFACIPESVAFRPARATPKPKAGTLNARVDGAGDGKFAEIDEHGRYKVQFPFDLSGKGGGGASRFCRMAQPYAGGGMGMHFPLHKGTEVVVVHINSDPDRPLIAGAVPNPETSSPVTGGNNAQCVIKTGGDNKIVIDDDEGRMTLSTPTANTKIRLGAHSSPHEGFYVCSDGAWTGILGLDHYLQVGRDQTIEVIGNDRHTVTLNRHTQISKDDKTFIDGVRTETIGQGQRTVVMSGDANLSVIAGNQLTVLTAGDGGWTAPLGTLTLDAREIVVHAGQRLVLQVGDGSRIEMTPTAIRAQAPTLDLAGTVHTLNFTRASWEVGQNVEITAGGNLALHAPSGTVDIKGALVDNNV